MEDNVDASTCSDMDGFYAAAVSSPAGGAVCSTDVPTDGINDVWGCGNGCIRDDCCGPLCCMMTSFWPAGQDGWDFGDDSIAEYESVTRTAVDATESPGGVLCCEVTARRRVMPAWVKDRIKLPE